jgi:hypothetical protein
MPPFMTIKAEIAKLRAENALLRAENATVRYADQMKTDKSRAPSQKWIGRTKSFARGNKPSSLGKKPEQIEIIGGLNQTREEIVSVRAYQGGLPGLGKRK